MTSKEKWSSEAFQRRAFQRVRVTKFKGLRAVELFIPSLDPGSDYLGGVVPKDGLESGFLAGSL